MHSSRHIPRRTVRRLPPRRGFTLTELLVAIGIVAILTVAIGQIFRSVGNIVSGGAALAEVDQLARSIERQLRDDVEALNRLRAEDTFIAIRMREIGDANHDGAVDENDGEVALYLTREDQEADIRSGIQPYAPGSLAVTRRVDEIMFLAQGAQPYASYQLDRVKDATDADSRIVPEAAAQIARIYWGHALRPYPDWDFNPDPDDPDAPIAPRRMYIPDGDFGVAVGEPNRFGDGRASEAGDTTGRNQFGAEWMLARQPLLLFGGAVAGYRDSDARSVAAAGDGREYAPYIRDLESLVRLQGFASDELSLSDVDTEEHVWSDLFQQSGPEARLIGWGRTDICAQSPVDVRRWLEGEPPVWQVGQGPAAAAPFADGRFLGYDDSDDHEPGGVNAWLWRRAQFPDPGGTNPTGQGNLNTAANVQRYHLRNLRSAIAGCFTRLLAEATPPFIDRAPRDAQTGTPIPEAQPEDALMDLHAVIASRCSNFEIAWSDGSVALRDVDIDNDLTNGHEIGRGDMLWFGLHDLNPTPGASNHMVVRSTYENWAMRLGNRLRRGDVKFAGDYTTPRSTAEPYSPAGANFSFMKEFPEVIPARRNPNHAFAALNTEFDSPYDNPGPPNLANYSTELTGGAPEDSEEYLAIWPFREPDADGAYDPDGWPKEIYLRVRITLHDAQRRLPNGKTYEFIYRIDPQATN